MISGDLFDGALLDPMNVIRDERLNRTIPTNAWNTILSSTEASALQGEEA